MSPFSYMGAAEVAEIQRRGALRRWSERAECHATEFEEAGDVTSARILRRLAEEARMPPPPAPPQPFALGVTILEGTLFAISGAGTVVLLAMMLSL